MECPLSSFMLYPISEIQSFLPHPLSRWARGMRFSHPTGIMFRAWCTMRIYNKKLSKSIRYPRRTKLPPELGVNLFLKRSSDINPSKTDLTDDHKGEDNDDEEEKDDNVWDPDEIEAISSLFQGRIPQKPGKLNRVRPLPLPLPHKLRPVGLPTSKRRIKVTSPQEVSSLASLSKQVYKNPEFLIALAREIRSLPKDEDIYSYLNKWTQFLRKGSLSLTIRELGHMGLPERALQTFCWVQKQPQLFPDDRVLASTVEILARSRDLKVPFNLKKLTSLASLSVMEAMARGYIRGGSLDLAVKLLMVAKNGKRLLDPSIYAKLILELGKKPDKEMYALALLNELGEREDLKLSQQDCTAVMKVCIRLGKHDIVESLFNWYKDSGHAPTVVMYTTVIHSHYSQEKYREALALVWEMEALNCLLDLPAYRVIIKLLAALDDLPRAVRYFSRLKEAGFAPTYDIYQAMIKIYIISGRLAKCREVCEEAELAGFKLDKQTKSQLQLRKLAVPGV